MLIVSLLSAQRSTSELDSTRKNEIRISLTNAIAGLPEINYERIFEENMSMGVAASISVESPEKMTMRWQVIPNYRLYFGKKKASGFFIEGNMAIVGQQKQYTLPIILSNPGVSYFIKYDEKAISVGSGAAIGVKLTTRNNYVGEIFAGGGRLFGNPLTEGYARVGIHLGKRF